MRHGTLAFIIPLRTPLVIMRTFIAVEIPEEVKRGMAQAQTRLKETGADASWTRPEGIHLTFKFLGEVQETRISEIMAALGRAAEGKSRFRLQVAGAGVFPNARNPRVVWVGVTGELDKLMALQVQVEEQMVRLGFEQEDRRFTPHLTLGRIKYLRSSDAWQRSLEAIKDITLPGFDVTAISLMKSELMRSGAVYTEIGRVELK